MQSAKHNIVDAQRLHRAFDQVLKTIVPNTKEHVFSEDEKV